MEQEQTQAEANDRVAQLEDQLKRCLADADNLRKHACREAERQRASISDQADGQWLTLVDALDQAERMTPADAATEWAEGLGALRAKATHILHERGLEAVGQPGETYDADLHEAAGMIPDPSRKNGEIAQTLEIGYRRNGRLVRPARVLVAQNG